MIADAAFDGDDIRRRVRQMRARCRIKPNPARKKPTRYGKERYKHRNLIERFFDAVKRLRRVATRYEKARNHLGAVRLAAVMTGLG